MKKIICALLAVAMCATSAVAISGCGESSNTKPGYVVPTTQPDLKSGDFGFFKLSNTELMITEYTGSSKDVTIPDSYEGYTVTTIGSSVFHGEKEIETVTVPDTVTAINDYAFASCKSLKSIKLSSNLETLGTNVFFNCGSLTSIELPSTLKEVGVYAFAASGLTSISIPESSTLTTLPTFMFYQCSSLKEVTIPATITEIGEKTFKECASDLTIKAPANSYALSYAASNNIATQTI